MLAGVLMIALMGCQGSQQPLHDAPSPLELGASADFAVPPRELLAAVKKAVAEAPISIGVEQETRDSVTTGWKPYRGDFHIARYWQERTRFRIIVIPDSEEPTARGRIQVDEETQQRAAKQQEFENASYLHRPERAREMTAAQLTEKLPQQGIRGTRDAAMPPADFAGAGRHVVAQDDPGTRRRFAGSENRLFGARGATDGADGQAGASTGARLA